MCALWLGIPDFTDFDLWKIGVILLSGPVLFGMVIVGIFRLMDKFRKD